jgi:hypothetical protein
MGMQGAGMAATPLGDSLRLHLPGQPGRPEVEDFIGGVYARRYGATVHHFAPVLVGLHDADGAITAAAGYRSAGDGPLFLERYLDAPVDMVLARHAARPPARPEIVEIGHLAAGRAGAGRRLMLLLGPHLAQRRFRWAVCTLTRELRQMMLRLGVTPLALGAADPSALGDEAAAWGSYYAHEPVVLAGEVQPALRRLAREAGDAP